MAIRAKSMAEDHTDDRLIVDDEDAGQSDPFQFSLYRRSRIRT
jgi:hypothetical protein